ncbi:MAG: hypothetical protein ACR2NN_02530 [Bryobacteraceae bacterium]
MIVELRPETERLVQEELQIGHFRTLDELIINGVYALREKSKSTRPIEAPRKPRKSFYQLMRESPLVGLELQFERQKDFDRPVEL